MEQRQMLALPRGAELLSVAVINEQPVLFALIRWAEQRRQTGQTEQRIIRIARTGEKFNSEGCRFLGTLVFNIGHTFHVFEQTGRHYDPREPRFQQDYLEVRSAATPE